MSVALDPGACWFRSLRADGERLVERRERAVFVSLPDAEAQRQLLERSGVTYTTGEGYLALIGQAAADLSPVFQTSCRDLLPYGDLPNDDPVARQIMAMLVESLLPEAATPGDLCCLIRCGGSTSDPGRLSRRTEFFTRLIRLRGFRPIELSAGMAVVYAGLADQAFSGIGLELGSCGCEVALAHRGVPLASFWIPRGGRWIDEQWARRAGWFVRDRQGRSKPDLALAAAAKRRFQGPLTNPVHPDERPLTSLYRELLTPVVRQLAQTLNPSGEVSPDQSKPLTLVCCGGATEVSGFSEFLSRLLQECPLPLPVGSVRVVDDPRTAVLRGGLIHTEVERILKRQPKSAA